MRTSRIIALAVLTAGLSVSYSAFAPPGGNGGGNGAGGGKKGGDGGGESSIRLCVDFDDSLGTTCGVTPCPANAISDGLTSQVTGFQYCDGYDGEFRTDDGGGIKIATDQRDTAPVNRTVRFTINAAQNNPVDCAEDVGALRDAIYTNEPLESFFGWSKRQFAAPDASCTPTDPFDSGTTFVESTLECLTNSEGITHDPTAMTEGVTEYRSWEMRLSDPNGSIKKSGLAFRTMYGVYWDDVCSDASDTLPVAIRCTDDSSGTCSQWRVKTFRGCVQDYSTVKGGNWNTAFTGCGINSDITLTVKPD